MMKKLVAIGLAVMMLLGAVPSLAQESPASVELKDNFSLELTVPAGYEAVKERMDTALYVSIAPQDFGKTSFILSIAYADLHDGPTPGEMTPEDVELAKQLVGSDFFDPAFTVRTAGGGTKFLVIDENGAEEDYALLIANYEGYFVQMYITPAEGLQVTEADVDTAMEILTSAELKTE